MSATLKQQLGHRDEVNERYEELGLPKGSKMYGRDAERHELLSLLKFEDGKKETVSYLLRIPETGLVENLLGVVYTNGNIIHNIKSSSAFVSCLLCKWCRDKKNYNLMFNLVGVYGMTGIGKSFLVKHTALQLMETKNAGTIVYVDASGMTNLSDVLVKLLQNPAINIFASGSKDHMMGQLRSYLTKRPHQRFILIFDDLSTLLDNEQSEQVYELLRFLLETKTKSALKVKVIATSQVILESVVDEKHKGSVKGLTLKFVDDDTSKSILQQNQMNLDDERKNMFLTKCKGHPFSLFVVSELTSMGFDFSEDSDLEEVANIKLQNQTDTLFQKAFDRLEMIQQLVLLACSLFDSEVQVDVLYELLNQKGPHKQFTNKVKHENLKRFWLSFKSVALDIGWVKSKRMTLAYAYHSLVRQFLRRLADKTMKSEMAIMHTELLQIKRLFVTNQMSELIEIGKRCLQHPQKASQQFLNQKVNIRTALEHTESLQSPELLFTKPSFDLHDDAARSHAPGSSNELRTLDDIVYLFLAFHEYHDNFDGKLLPVLDSVLQLCATERLDPTHRALIRTLHLVILRQNKNWAELDKSLKEMDNDVEFFSHVDEQPLLMIDAMVSYARGKLYTSGLHYGNDTDEVFSATRMKYLNECFSKLETFPRSLSLPIKYFQIHLMMVLAEAEWMGISDLGRIQKAYLICVRAEKFSKDVYTLKPLALVELGTYLKNEANVLYKQKNKSSYDEAEKLYMRSQKCFEEALAEYRNRKIETSTSATTAIQSLSMLYICLGNSFTRDQHIDEGKKEERRKQGIQFFRDAVGYCEEATEAFTILNSASKLALVKSITLKAEALGLLIGALKEDNSSLENNQKLRQEELQYFENLRLQALIKAYNYYLTDPLHCNLVPGNPTYKRIHWLLPALKEHSFDPDVVQKVTDQLQVIEDNDERKKKGEPLLEVDTDALLMEQDSNETNPHQYSSTTDASVEVSESVGQQIVESFAKK